MDNEQWDEPKNAVPQYRVRTPENPAYNGKRYGVQFSNGQAYLDQTTVPAHIERTVDDVARQMLVEWKLDVRGLTPEAQANVKEWTTAQANAEPGRSGYPLKTPKTKKNVIVKGEGEYRSEPRAA